MKAISIRKPALLRGMNIDSALFPAGVQDAQASEVVSGGDAKLLIKH